MRHRLRLLLAVLPLTGALTAAGAAVGAVPAIQPCSASTYTHRVAVVAEHGDGRVIRVCVGFDGAAISAEEALHASGIEYQTVAYGSLGDAVCQVDGEPAQYPPSCWTSSSPYWAFFVSRHDGAWALAGGGVSNTMLQDGDAAGFRYDPQTGPGPPVSAAGTCAAAASTAPTAAHATPDSTHAAAASPAGPAGATPAGTSPPASGAATPAPAALGGAPTAASALSHPSGPQPALLAAVAAMGALAGLLGVQLTRRRRLR